MSFLHTPPRLVRMQDRLTLHAESGPIWRINERTRFLEARLGLSYTGVRPYRTEGGIVRVLRRPEQVNSPGHLKTLRRLPGTDGHPADDVDVSPANYAELVVGWTGDEISVEEYNGYPRPVGNTTVMRPEVIASMVSEEEWKVLRERFEAFANVTRAPGPANTGNSLGYNALWFGPQIESEIKSERDDDGDGGENLVGVWEGPHGPEEYDIEHYVDPHCDVVLQLAEETDFNPDSLGGQHIALNLKRLGGRGAHQSELMRVVDSRAIVIDRDHGRNARPLALQVHRRGTGDAMPEWTVSAARDLPIASGDWDGDAAKASVFEWAGWPDKPDPGKAKRAFLIHDASASELIGSYKLPFAQYRDGKLEAVDAGLRAAASRLPQTDAPQDVLDRAREVLDTYFTKLDTADETARDKGSTDMATDIVKRKITLDFGRKNTAELTKRLATRGVVVPSATTLVLDEVDAEKFAPALESISGIVAELLAMLGETEDASAEAVAGKEEEMGDMMTKAEAEELIKLKEEELAAAKEALKSAADSNVKLTADNAKLTTDLAPLLSAALTRLIAQAITLGADKTKVNDAADAGAVKRVVVLSKLGETYAKASDAAIEIAYDMAVKSAPADATGGDKGTRDNAGDGGGGVFEKVPGLSIVGRDAKGKGDNNDAGRSEPSTAEQLASGMGSIGG